MRACEGGNILQTVVSSFHDSTQLLRAFAVSIV
jgi:hypothetical protein